jgi:hypothetical protein
MRTRHTFRIVAFFAVAHFAAAAQAQSSVEVSPKPVKADAPAYESITFVTEGPAHSFSDGDVRGRFERIVVLDPGIAYDHPTIRLETLTYGDEACCRRVKSAWELDLNDLGEKGLLLPEAATNQLRFLRWNSPRTAEFRYGKLICQFRSIGSAKVMISCRE